MAGSSVVNFLSKKLVTQALSAILASLVSLISELFISAPIGAVQRPPLLHPQVPFIVISGVAEAVEHLTIAEIDFATGSLAITVGIRDPAPHSCRRQQSQ